MCLIFFAINNHPTYKLVVAANRDEFYARKTAPAEFWKDAPHIVGGRDLEASGTWLAMNRRGKISIITNYRDPANINPAAPSRGKLVSDFLLNEETAESYLKNLESKAHLYNGFNLLVGTFDDLWYLSNYRPGILLVPNGFHGLSNHLLDTPWPKVERGKVKLQPILQQSIIDPAELFECMYDEQRASDVQLPETGIGLERERALSSMFIKTPNYGSRCSTVILVDHANHVLFSERVYDLTTFAFTTRTFEFNIDPA